MAKQLQMLQSDDVFNRLPIRIPEWDKLQAHRALIESLPVIPSLPVLVSLSETERLQTAYRNLTAALLSAFHSWITDALVLDRFTSTHHNFLVLLEAQRDHYIPATPDRKPLPDLYASLSPPQKALTPLFWKHLHQQAHTTRHLSHPPTGTSTFLPNTIFDLAATFNAHLSTLCLTQPLTLTRFDPVDFRRDLLLAIQHLHPALQDVESGIPFFLSDHLLLASLDQENELNYLPIWADGLDDGSGGVFQEAVPAAEMGPNQPGPGYHTGYTIAGTEATATETEGGFSVVHDGAGTQKGGGYAESMVSISDLGVGVLSLGGTSHTVDGSLSTVGRSVVVQGSGQATTRGTATGSMVIMEEEEEGMYRDARYVVPAGHQAQGLAVERYVEEVDMDKESEEEEEEEEEMDFDGGSSDGSSTLDGFEEIDGDELL